MERIEIFDKVRAVVVDQLGGVADDFAEETTFDELDADSLDLIEIVTALEDEFGASIPDEDLEGIKTLAEAVDAIAKQLG